MALTANELLTKPISRYDIQESVPIEITTPCRLMGLTYTGGVGAAESVMVGTTVETIQALVTIVPGAAVVLDFGPNGIRYETLYITLLGETTEGVGTVFVLLE